MASGRSSGSAPCAEAIPGGDPIASSLPDVLPTFAQVLVSSRLEPRLWALTTKPEAVAQPHATITFSAQDEDNRPPLAPLDDLFLTIEGLGSSPSPTGAADPCNSQPRSSRAIRSRCP